MPQTFSVYDLKEGEVQFPAETIDEELFEIRFGLDREHEGAQIAEADLDRLPKAQFRKRVAAQRDGVIEELAHEIDARFAVAARA